MRRTRTGPRIPAVEDRLRGLRRRPDGRAHDVVAFETEAPGCIEIACMTCGERTWTPWGEAHAAEITALHLWAMGMVELVPTVIEL